jgi:hypothetical protein
METIEVTQDEISSLPHRAKAAFAITCARIAWDGLTRRQWHRAPAYLEGALVDVELLATPPAASLEEKTLLASNMPGLVARADGEPGGQCASALARSIREVLAVILLDAEAANARLSAADHANEAYRWALHATRIAPLGAGVLAERDFLIEVRKALDALLASASAPLVTDKDVEENLS